MSVEMYRDLGAHAAQIASLEKKVDQLTKTTEDLQKSITQLNSILEQTKGSVRTLLVIGSLSGAVGAFIVKLVAWVKGVPT